MGDVKKWLTETFDVDLDHLDICTVGERGERGVKALTTIPNGEYIIKLPLNALITRSFCESIPELSNCDNFETCEFLAVFLALFCERECPEYYASLPETIDHALFWPQTDVDLLDKEIRKEYQRYLNHYTRRYKNVSKKFHLDESKFRLAWARLNTRETGTIQDFSLSRMMLHPIQYPIPRYSILILGRRDDLVLFH